jgi:hypothetical protein
MAAPRFTREIATALGAKIAVKITPDNNQIVALVDDEMAYACSLDPKAAHQLGQALVQAARLAAMNVLDPMPVRAPVAERHPQEDSPSMPEGYFT